MKYYVKVIEYGTDKVVKKLGPFSKQRADKIDDGLNINLDHEHYFTTIVKGR